MEPQKKKFISYVVLIVAIVALLTVALWNGLVVRRYVLSSKKLTDPVRLLILSDLHSSMYGKNQSLLLAKIRELKPDLVFLVGDIVDDKRPQEGALQLLEAIAPEYPCFYVTGNHEFWSGRADNIKTQFAVTALRFWRVTVKLLQLGGKESKCVV